MAEEAVIQKREINFTNAQLRRLLIPLLLEQLLGITVGLADSLMVATVGEAAISAVSLVDSISNLMIYIFSALATGGAVVAGQYIGRRERDRARDAGRQLVVLLAVISGGLMALLYIFKHFVLTTVFGAIAPDVMTACDTYYTIVMASIPFIALYNGGAALFRTMGRSAVSLQVSLLMNAINVCGNALLIFGAKMDVAGVAIPTLISRAVAAFVILHKLHDDSLTLSLGTWHEYRYSGRLVKNILSIAVPSGVENGMFHFGRLILFSLIATFGTPSITANAIGNTVGNFHCFAGCAIGLGLSTVASQCVGAGDYEKTRYYTRKLTKLCYALMIGFNALFALSISLILKLYGVSPETAKLATSVMLIHGLSSMVLWTPSFLICNTLRAAGDARFTMTVSTLTMWILRVGGGYFISVVLGYGVVGVWFAHAIVDWFTRSVLFTLRYRGQHWEHHLMR